MSKSGPIILIDDDIDDQDLFKSILGDLKVTNPLHIFLDCKKALAYLCDTDERPFIIFCDINMPAMSGLEFKQQIDLNPELRRRSIPFIFYSTSASQLDIDRAYMKLNIQGFFVKPTTYTINLDLIGRILNYWEVCRHPNS